MAFDLGEQERAVSFIRHAHALKVSAREAQQRCAVHCLPLEDLRVRLGLRLAKVVAEGVDEPQHLLRLCVGAYLYMCMYVSVDLSGHTCIDT